MAPWAILILNDSRKYRKEAFFMNERKNIPYRFFWNWDHSTNWCLNTLGEQNCGVGNPYLKRGDFFEKDFCRMIDWCADHKMTATGIVGMLRDDHGGVDSARRVCAYAQEKGVKVYIIAGLFAYGGIYYEGNHKYSLDRFLEKNPECMGKTPDGAPLYKKFQHPYGIKNDPQGCSSNPLLHEFVLESLDWLFREIPELGGIQMESGDTGVCDCELCRARRGNAAAKEPLSIADMAGIYPDAAATIRRVNPGALIICETYHHFLDPECQYFNAENPSDDLKKLLAMPESTFWQWKCDRRLRNEPWPLNQPMLPAMQKFHHVMRSHCGTQWWGGRHTLDVERIRKQCQLSHASGLDAVSMFGEASPFHTNSEFNYLALEYFADNPSAKMESFVTDVMAPRLGGRDIAARYYEMAYCIRTDWQKIPAYTREIAQIQAGITGDEQLRRWQYLANFLQSFYWEGRLNGDTWDVGVKRGGGDRPDE